MSNFKIQRTRRHNHLLCHRGVTKSSGSCFHSIKALDFYNPQKLLNGTKTVQTTKFYCLLHAESVAYCSGSSALKRTNPLILNTMYFPLEHNLNHPLKKKFYGNFSKRLVPSLYKTTPGKKIAQQAYGNGYTIFPANEKEAEIITQTKTLC